MGVAATKVGRAVIEGAGSAVTSADPELSGPAVGVLAPVGARVFVDREFGPLHEAVPQTTNTNVSNRKSAAPMCTFLTIPPKGRPWQDNADGLSCGVKATPKRRP